MGNVEPYSTINVKALVGGTLVKVYFTEGAMVKKGDPLFQIYQQPFKEAIRRWEATLERDRALLRQAEANHGRLQAQEAHYTTQFERYQKLAAEGIFSKETAEQMGVELKSRRSGVRAEAAAVDSARAAIAADEAELAQAKLNLSYTEIRSPINGRTGQIKVQEGNLVKANDVELVTIHQIQPIHVAFSVPESHLNAIRARQAKGGKLAVRAAIPSDTSGAADGALTFIDNAVDRATGTFRMKGEFANASAKLWPGQFVEVRLRVEESSATVTVPAAAVQNGQSGTFVYVVTGQGTADLRPVTAGARFESRVAVAGNLQPGDRVVTDGHLRLIPGARVRVLP
jgi:multidrug efflux system membrane fusion protein